MLLTTNILLFSQCFLPSQIKFLIHMYCVICKCFQYGQGWNFVPLLESHLWWETIFLVCFSASTCMVCFPLTSGITQIKVLCRCGKLETLPWRPMYSLIIEQLVNASYVCISKFMSLSWNSAISRSVHLHNFRSAEHSPSSVVRRLSSTFYIVYALEPHCQSDTLETWLEFFPQLNLDWV